MERGVIGVKEAYVVVKFRCSRAPDGGESWIPAAKFAGLFWVGMVAASAVEAEHAITTVDSRERACIIQIALARCKLQRVWEGLI